MKNERHIGKAINIVSHKIRRKVGKEVSKYGITEVQSKIICFIYVNSKKRDVFQKDIEKEFKIRSASVTSVIQLMEKKNYIERVCVKKDARLKKLVLTEEGNKIYEKVFLEICNIEKKIMKILTIEEKENLFYICDKLMKNIGD